MPMEIFDESRMKLQEKKFASTVFKIGETVLSKFRETEDRMAAEQEAAVERMKRAKGATDNMRLRTVGDWNEDILG